MGLLVVMIVIYMITIFFGIEYVNKEVNYKIKKSANDYLEEMEGLDIDKGTYKTSVKFYVLSSAIIAYGVFPVIYLGYESGLMVEGLGFLGFVIVVNLAILFLRAKERVVVKDGYVEVKKIWGVKKIDLRDIGVYKLWGLKLTFYKGDRVEDGMEVGRMFLKYRDNHKLIAEIEREVSKYKGEDVR